MKNSILIVIGCLLCNTVIAQTSFQVGPARVTVNDCKIILAAQPKGDYAGCEDGKVIKNFEILFTASLVDGDIEFSENNKRIEFSCKGGDANKCVNVIVQKKGNGSVGCTKSIAGFFERSDKTISGKDSDSLISANKMCMSNNISGGASNQTNIASRGGVKAVRYLEATKSIGIECNDRYLTTLNKNSSGEWCERSRAGSYQCFRSEHQTAQHVCQ